MKINILFIILFVFIKSNAQNLRKYIPFKHENKWGIVDSSRTEITKPQFKSINIFNNFGYAEFDKKIIYNLKTGEKYPAFGEYKSTVKIEGDNYYLFTNSKKSILINLEKKDTINLSLRYNHMTTVDFYNTDLYNQKKTNSLIVAYLSNGSVLFLKNNKSLNTFLPKKLETYNIELIESYKNKAIGFVVKIDNYICFYDHNLNIIKKTLDTRKDSYELLSSEIISDIYKMDNTQIGCFSCDTVWDNSWKPQNKLTNNTSEKLNKYYLTYDSKKYYLKSISDSNYNLRVKLKYFYYPSKYKSVAILDTNSLFFYDSEFMHVEKIMFPEKYLILNN